MTNFINTQTLVYTKGVPNAPPYSEPPYAVVVDTPQPTSGVDYTKDVVETAPVNTGGVWYRAWSIVDATPQEIADRLVAARKPQAITGYNAMIERRAGRLEKSGDKLGALNLRVKLLQKEVG